MTEETQQSEAPVQPDSQSSTPDATKPRENKKERCRPMTKVVIRRLPPSMTQDQFKEQVSPLPEHDYLHYVKADMSLGQHAFSRAYINFIDQQDIFIFREKFDNYVFVDSKGTEYPAVVEFAPFQRLPKKRVGKKKDMKCGTLESDPYYISFLDSLKNQDTESGGGQPKTEYSYQPSDNVQKKVTTTPLLEYLKQRKQEKQRLRDEKREERRRRDLERRRAKDEPTINKVLKNPEFGRETNKDSTEYREEKEKLSPKELKNRNKREDKPRDKQTRERDAKAPAKSYRDREDRNKEREAKHPKRHEDKKPYGRKDDRDNPKEDRRNDAKEERRNDTREEVKEVKEKKVEEKRGKSYEKMRQEKKRLAEAKKQNAEGGIESANNTKPKREERDPAQKKEKRTETVATSAKKTEKMHVLKEDSKKKDEKPKPQEEPESNEGKTLEAEVTREDKLEISESKENVDKSEKEVEPRVSQEIVSEDSTKSKSTDNIDAKPCYTTETDTKKDLKLVKRRSSLESGGQGGGGDGGTLRRHKSLDGGDQSSFKKDENEDKEKDKKDPRLERRIRNKDRPAMEIYRPGMGRFSKQRLEREKSNNDDRASLSQSPTPSSTPSTSSKSNKTAAEVRSMTFKRSVSRDLP